jgi:tRNA (guanine37-N1)-methyltransferase
MDLLEYPHYTRPEEIFGIKVPEVLISGNHRKIGEWRRDESIEKTKRVRPDLYRKYLIRKISGE